MKRYPLIALLMLSIFATGFSSEESWNQEENLISMSEEYVVTASKTKKKISEAPGIVTVITSEEIKNMGARTWTDVLETVPGFECTRGHHGNYNLGVRGFTIDKSNKIKVMMDGHSITELFGGSAFHFNFSEMPVDFIDRIEIIRGPGSALYGENAFLAVINIITKKAEDIDGTILRGGWASYETQNYNMLFGKTLKDLKVSAYADFFKSDGGDLEIERDFQGNKGHTDDWSNRKYAHFNMVYKELDFTSFFMKKDSGTNTSTSFAATDDGYFDVTQMFDELKYEHQATSKLTLKPRLYFDLFEFAFQDELRTEGSRYPKTTSPVYPDGVVIRRSTQTVRFGGELEAHYQLFDGNELLGGYQYQYDYVRDPTLWANFDPRNNTQLAGGYQDVTSFANFLDPQFQQHFWAVYLQDEWAVNNAVSLTAGGRYDHYNSFGGKFNPRLSLVWNVVDKLYMKLLYGEAFRSPDVLEQTSRNNPTSLGNASIKPEKMHTYEAGLNYNPSKYFNGEVNLFYDEITDCITFDKTTSLWVYVNGSKVLTRGVELSLKSERSKDTYAMVNYSYAKGEEKDRATGAWSAIPDISRQKVNLVLNTYIIEYLNGNITVLFRDSKKRAAGDPRGDNPSHCVVNLTMLAHNFYPDLEVSFSLFNLFDKTYADPATTALYYDMPRDGRTYWVYLRYAL